MASAADVHHHGSALAAEQFFRQQIVGLGVLMRCDFLVVSQHLLHLAEDLQLHDGRDSVLNSCFVLVGVDPNILFIPQQSACAGYCW